MSKNNFWMVVVAMFSFLTAFACEDDLKQMKTTEEVRYFLDYDVEATEMETAVHNGQSRTIATFQVNVATESEEDVYLKVITFRLVGDSTQGTDKELSFYGALSNVRVIAYGEELETHRFSAYEITLATPLWVGRNYGLELTIVADVDTPEEEVSGIIQVENVLFGNSDESGYDTIRWESTFKPYLGTSATAISSLIDGWMGANWQFPTVRIENCTEFEVQLWDGSCVYDNCQTLPDVCGYYGQCQTDLQDGRLFCECDPGFTPASTLRLECIRDAQFDIEAKRGVIPVTANQSWQTLGEWYLYTNGVEDGNLISVMFNFRGAVSFFANFRVVLVSPDGAAMFFPNEPVNPSPYDIYNGIDRFRLFVNTGTNDPSVYRISKEQEGYRILLIGDVLGAGLGAEVEISIDSATILSSEIQSRDGYSLLFLGNHLLGESEQDSYLCPLTNPIARVVQ